MITNDGKVSAVLDWELCTLGDPLADVGYLLNSWVAPGERGRGSDADICRGLLQSRNPVGAICPRAPVEIWRTLTITGLSHTGVWLPLIRVYKRYLVGAMGEGHDVDLDAQKEGVFTLSEWALELLS